MVMTLRSGARRSEAKLASLDPFLTAISRELNDQIKVLKLEGLSMKAVSLNIVSDWFIKFSE